MPISVKFRDFSAFTFIHESFQSFIIQQLLCGFCCLKMTMAGDVPPETAAGMRAQYLSVPANSVDDERSISQYTNVSAMECQRLSASNLANQVIIAKNSKLGSSQ